MALPDLPPYLNGFNGDPGGRFLAYARQRRRRTPVWRARNGPPFQPGSLLAPWAQQCELGWRADLFGGKRIWCVPGRRPRQCRGRDVALYVDDAIWHWQGLQWAHLLADGVDELHRFAADLGINRLSYQGPPRTSVPHYDLTAYERRRAIAQGAIACSRHEIVAVVRRARSEKTAWRA